MMTRKEAIKHLRNDWFMSLGGQLCVDEDKKDAFLEAIGMGIKALRPVSREQVEKVWRGEWAKVGSYAECKKCGHMPTNGKTHFCSHCGSAMTDEAVDIIMRRLETLYETT